MIPFPKDNLTKDFPIFRLCQYHRNNTSRGKLTHVVVHIFLVTSNIHSLTSRNSAVDSVKTAPETVDGGVMVQESLVRSRLERGSIRSSSWAVKMAQNMKRYPLFVVKQYLLESVNRRKDRVDVETAAAIVDIDIADHRGSRRRPEGLKEAKQVGRLGGIGGSTGRVALCCGECSTFAE